MTKKEQVLQRQMKLFHVIKAWDGTFLLSDQSIIDMMGDYNNRKTLQRDIETLKQKFLISTFQRFISPTKSIREIKVINYRKELLRQCNYEYLEALMLSNSHCFKIKWRDGYNYKEGGVRKYVDEKNANTIVGTRWHGTGIYLLSQPSKLLSSKPIKYSNNNDVNNPDYKSYLDTRPCAF